MFYVITVTLRFVSHNMGRVKSDFLPSFNKYRNLRVILDRRRRIINS